jgi:E3 ubiquitin-protein ligase UBR7
MFQCLGIGTVETGGCGEDWWHPECLIGLSRDWNKAAPKVKVDGDATNDAHDEEEETPLPPGFPLEDDFHHLICFKCVDSNPWIKPYAGTPGFLPPVFKEGGLKKDTKAAFNDSASTVDFKESRSGETESKEIERKESMPKMPEQSNSKKRKADDEDYLEEDHTTKRTKEESVPVKEQKYEPPSIKEVPVKAEEEIKTTLSSSAPKHTTLPETTPSESFSLFALEEFHDQLCRCAECFPRLAPHPQLREEEDTYEPPLSEDGEANGAASTGTGSILERGEAAFNNIDRVRAIEGAMAYNHLRDNLKEFLRPFAESGQAVSADDIKSHFEKLRGDDQGIKDAAGHASAVGGSHDEEGTDGDSRREQNGKLN